MRLDVTVMLHVGNRVTAESPEKGLWGMMHRLTYGKTSRRLMGSFLRSCRGQSLRPAMQERRDSSEPPFEWPVAEYNFNRCIIASWIWTTSETALRASVVQHRMETYFFRVQRPCTCIDLNCYLMWSVAVTPDSKACYPWLLHVYIDDTVKWDYRKTRVTTGIGSPSAVLLGPANGNKRLGLEGINQLPCTASVTGRALAFMTVASVFEEWGLLRRLTISCRHWGGASLPRGFTV